MKKSINVIFIGAFLYPNGYAATKRKQQFLDYIIAQGDFARVLITMKLSQGHEFNDLKGIHNSVPYEVLGANVKPDILFPITILTFYGKSISRLIKYKKRDAKNIIVAFGINFDTILPLFFAKLIGYKIVFDIVEDFSTVTGEGKGKRLKYWILRTFPKYFIKYIASGISVISSYLQKKYSDRIVNIPICIIPVSAANLFLELNKKQNNDFSLVYSGTYGQKEGLPILAEGFKKFSAFISNTKLILTGNCPDNVKNMFLGKLGNFENVLFTGRLNDDDYYRTLNNADVLLMTRNNSVYANAGFPYKLGEYLATGNPVIATRVSDVEIYLKDKVSVFIINPDDVNDLYSALVNIYQNRKFAREVGLRGKDVCKQYFNPEINSKSFYTLLQKS